MTRGLLLLAAAGLLWADSPLAGLCPSRPGPDVFYDGDFSDGDWTVTNFLGGAGGSSSGNQVPTGGNGGSYRKIDITVGPGAPGRVAHVGSVHLKNSATYNPRTSGPISAITYCEDALVLNAFGDGQGQGLAVRQSGKVYIYQTGVTGLPSTWTTVAKNILPAEFVEMVSSPDLFDATSHPDFSANGAPLQFGFFRANTARGNVYSTSIGIDNWGVTIAKGSNPLLPSDDFYNARGNPKTLVVPAPGVLANDFVSPDSVVLVSGPRHGVLNLEANGAFTYLPDAGFVGRDDFRYRAKRGSEISDPAIAIIDVEPARCTIDPGNVTAYVTIHLVVKVPLTVTVTWHGRPLVHELVEGNFTDQNGQFVTTPLVNYEDRDQTIIESIKADSLSGPHEFECHSNIRVEVSVFSVLFEVCVYLYSPSFTNSPAASLDLYRDFRDRVLARSQRGKHIAEMYYRFRPELLQLILRHPGLMQRARELIQKNSGVVQTLARGEPASLTAEDLALADEILASIGTAGSKELRQATDQIRRDLRAPSTLAELGIGVRKPATQNELREAFRKLPLHFESLGNGFIARGPGYGIRLDAGTASIALAGNRNLSLKLEGAAPRTAVPEDSLGVTHYLLGKSRSDWRSNVRRWSRVRYPSVYPGIDLVYYGHQRDLEYDLVVAAGASIAPVKLSFPGAERIQTEADGDLTLEQNGTKLTLHAPVAYQMRNGTRELVAARYMVLPGNRAAFSIGRYDRTLPLVIDPVLSYGSFLGGPDLDTTMAIAVDSAGNAYVTGATTSVSLFTGTQGRHKEGGWFNSDGIVTKFDPTGSTVLYSTYFGGSSDDIGLAIALDAQGNAYVTGMTRSPDFPTNGAFQSTFRSGPLFQSDAFVLKLDPTGSRILYSSYLGGTGDEAARGIAVDASGNAYVAGVTSSTNFPLMNPRQAANLDGPNYHSDAFVAKINPTGSALAYSTYLGGHADDIAMGIAVDASGNTAVVGTTYSTDFPALRGFQSKLGGGSDAFLTRIDPTGATTYSTYLGGSSDEWGFGVALDTQGLAYVTGFTGSANFPTASAAQPKLGGDGFDAFVTKFGTAGSTLAYSTFLGGAGTDYGYGIAVDDTGAAFVTGETGSADFATAGTLQPTRGGNIDGFLAKLTPAGAFEYRTYLGGSSTELSIGVALDRQGAAYLAGFAQSIDTPLTFGSFQTAARGPIDGWILKVAPGNTPPRVAAVSAASFSPGLAPLSIASAFGTGFATRVATAASPQDSLDNLTLLIKDAAGTERAASLFLTTPNQINFLVPSGTSTGLAAMTVKRGAETIATGVAPIAPLAPAIFTANASGRGTPAGFALVVSPNGTRREEPLFDCSVGPGNCRPQPIDLGPAGTEVYLLLFGTGIRNLQKPATATTGAISIPVLAAVAQGEYPGLDQINLGPLPRLLRGDLDLVIKVDDKETNSVKIQIR